MSPPASAAARSASARPKSPPRAASARSAPSGRPASARAASARSASARPKPGERRSRPAGRGAPPRRPPRRYSGPAGGISSAAAAVAVPAPLVAPPRRARPAPQPQRLPARRARPRSAPSLAALASPRRLLELSLRGRGWIALVAFALIGIVTAQLIVLRLNTDIGRSLQRAAALQRANATLSIGDSEAASGEKVEALARGLGMTAAAPGQLLFRPAVSRSRAEAAATAPGVGG
jgi:hypothetical protein